jgi:hypothetical protein
VLIAKCPRADLLVYDPNTKKGTIFDLVIKMMTWGKGMAVEEGEAEKTKHYKTQYKLGNFVVFGAIAWTSNSTQTPLPPGLGRR